MKSIVIIYHAHCPDGFGAAYAAWKKFKDRAEYVPLNPRELPLKIPKKKEVYILDNSYSSEVQKKWRAQNQKVVIIDHHMSSEKDVTQFSENIFDNNHSGAVLSWKYFHPTKKIPLFLRYIEDFDLWKWKLPHTAKVVPLFKLFKKDFKIWDKLVKNFESTQKRKKYLEKGKLLKNYDDTLIKSISDRAELVKFEGYKVLAVNSPVFRSQLGNALIKMRPPISIIWNEQEGMKLISLRSNGKIDVSKIAARYGGGGHHNAAGFSLPATQLLPWKKIN